jgi:hypothetical protein
VAMETPARRATSRILAAPGRRFEGLFLETLTVRELYAVPSVSQLRLLREIKPQTY